MNVRLISEAFQQALDSGKVPKPKLRFRGTQEAADIHITRAPDSGKNKGFLYVKEIIDNDWDNSIYLGKIHAEGGAFYPTRECSLSTHYMLRLRAIAADPFGEAQSYGNESGHCCCCGRELSNPISVELGIGPICRGYYGWGVPVVELPDLVNLNLLEELGIKDPELEAAFAEEAKSMAEANAREEEIITVELSRADFNTLQSMILEYQTKEV